MKMYICVCVHVCVLLKGRITGWGENESERGMGKEGRQRGEDASGWRVRKMVYTSTPFSTCPAFSNNRGFDGAQKQAAVLNA